MLDKKSLAPKLFVESKWQLSMHTFMAQQTILPNMNEIRPVVSEELSSQECVAYTLLENAQSPITPTIFVK